MVKRDNVNSGFTEEEKMAMAEHAKELIKVLSEYIDL